MGHVHIREDEKQKTFWSENLKGRVLLKEVAVLRIKVDLKR